eukprot:s1804_g1.t1
METDQPWLSGQKYSFYQDNSHFPWAASKERVQKVAEVYVQLEDDARVLVCRRRVFANRVIRLWVEDAPERGGILIRAHDEAAGGSGHLDISDEQLRHAYRHFAHGRLGGMPAQMALPRDGVMKGLPPVKTDEAMEVALTQELVASLLDAVRFEVNSFGDEWTIYLPGFGLKARSEVPQGPAMQVTAQPPVAGMPTRKLSDGGHGGAGHLPPPPGSGRVDLPAGDPHLSGGRRDQHRHPDHFRGRATRNSEQSAGHGGQGPIPNRRTIASAQGEPLQLPGEPLTGEECDLPEEDVHTAQHPRTSEWYNTNGNMLLGRPFSARARPSSAPRPTSPSRKPWIPPGIPQMLAMLYPEPPEASEVLVRVAGHIESECLLEVTERPSGSVCLVEETTVQGIIIRVLSEDIGGTCETYAADLVRMGIQLPLWTSREMARFSSSPSLQEKACNRCCMVEQVWVSTSPTSARMTVSEIVAESLAAAEVFRECLLQSAPLHESRKCVDSLICELLETSEKQKRRTAPPHCEERFGCILGGALDAGSPQVEHVCPFIRLHSLWRLVAVVLTWRYLAQMRTATAKADLNEDMGILKRRAETALEVFRGRLVDSAGGILDVGASVKRARLHNGDSLGLHIGRVQVQTTEAAFAAILDDGSVVTWGAAHDGGASRAVQHQMNGVQQVQATDHAFAAIRGDGSIVTWGGAGAGGDSSAVQGQLNNVKHIQASYSAFAAILGNGSVVTWGAARAGGHSSGVQNPLKNVQQIQATRHAFAASLSDGSVVTWGDADCGGDSRAVQHHLINVQRIQATVCTLAAILGDGSFEPFLAKPGCITSSLPGASPPEIGQAYFHAVINPMMEAEERARCEVAEEAANKALAELLAEVQTAPGKRKAVKAKRGKKSDTGWEFMLYGVQGGHQMPPTLLNLDSSRPRSAPRRRSRPMSAQQSKRNGPWPGRRVAPWMDTARAGLPESWPDGNDFARGTTL